MIPEFYYLGESGVLTRIAFVFGALWYGGVIRHPPGRLLFCGPQWTGRRG